MEDIAPTLWAAIKKDILASIVADQRIKQMQEALVNGTATFSQADEFAVLVGEHYSTVLRKYLNDRTLPYGRLYYNIAQRTLVPALELEHKSVVDFATAVIEQIHREAGLGIKAVKPAIDRDRVDGLVNKVTAVEKIEDAEWVLREPIINFAQHVAAATVEENARFVNGLGRQCYIRRIEARQCCKWCHNLAGRYSYPETPKDIFRRHENCRCQVLYEDGTGPSVDVHKKRAVYDPAKRQTEIEAAHPLKARKTGRALEEEVIKSAKGKKRQSEPH